MPILISVTRSGRILPRIRLFFKRRLVMEGNRWRIVGKYGIMNFLNEVYVQAENGSTYAENGSTYKDNMKHG
jgi:hypothetical protein